MEVVERIDCRLSPLLGRSQGTVVGSYRTSVNMRFDGYGGLCTLLTEVSDDGPGGMILAPGQAPAPFNRAIHAGETAGFSGGILTVGLTAFDARHAEPFDCSIRDSGWRASPEAASSMAEMLKSELSRAGQSEVSDAVRRFVADRFESLRDALLNGSRESISHAVDGLIGLGPGLTPSGDDQVTGCLAALRFSLGPEDNLTLAVSSAAGKRLGVTTDVGASMLSAALEGRFRGVVRDLLAALKALDSQETHRCMAPLLHVGATSGRDMAEGILAGLEAAAMRKE